MPLTQKMKKQFIVLTLLLIALTALAACNGSKNDGATVTSPDVNPNATETSATPTSPTTSEAPTTTEYPDWDEISGGTTPYIPPLKETDAENAENETTPMPVTEPGEVKPVPTRPPDVEVVASMPPATPTPEVTVAPKPTPTQKPTASEAPAPTVAPAPMPATTTPEPESTSTQGKEPYVDDEGKYHEPVQTMDGGWIEKIYYQDSEGGWHEGWYEQDGEWYERKYYRPGTHPLSAPGAPWNEEVKNSLAETTTVNKELDKLINQGYARKDALEKLYEMGLVTRTIWDKYTIKYLTIENRAEVGYTHDYDGQGFPFRDKNENWVSSYLDNANYTVKGFYYEGGNPCYDESGNYVGQRIQHDEEGMHWERNASGKMVGTYKGVVIPEPWVAPIPPLG